MLIDIHTHVQQFNKEDIEILITNSINNNVNIIIYNTLGQRVKVFSMINTPAGTHAITWNAINQNGQPLRAGVYLYQMISEDFVKTRKMILLK